MTEFLYNSITLGFVKTVNLGQQAVYDPSNTDLLYTKFTIHLRTVISAGVGLINELPADTMVRIRHMLLTPRRSLRLMHGGKVLIAVAAFDVAGNALDDANGPKPQHCTITQITDHTYEIDYVVEVCLTDCNNLTGRTVSQLSRRGGSLERQLLDEFDRVTFGGVPVQADWLSCRWSMSHDIDENGYSKVRTSGKLITRASLLLRGGPDMLRGMVTPIPIPGFRRHSSYKVAEDGLSLSFDFTDTELYICPPPGCTQARGTHTVSTGNFGAMYMIDVDIALEGRKDFDKTTLMDFAVAIALDRIRLSTPLKHGKTGKIMVKRGSFQEDLYGPGVHVHLSAQATGPQVVGQNKSETGDSIRKLLDSGIMGALGIVGGKIADLIDGKKQADEAKKAPPKVIENFRFGHAPLGSAIDGPLVMTFGERAYMPFLMLMASAFNDPCLQRALSVPDQESSLKRGLPIPDPDSIGTLKSVDKVSQSAMPSIEKGVSAVTESALKSTAKISIVDYTEDAIFVEAEVTDGGVWDYWDCDYAYSRDTGRRAMPPMSTSGTVAFPQVHQESMTMVVRWIAKKINVAPTIPDSVSTDSNLTLLSAYRGYSGMELAGDGQTVIYSSNGEYRYGVADWTKVDETFPIPPWMAMTRKDLDTVKLERVIRGDGGSTNTLAVGP